MMTVEDVARAMDRVEYREESKRFDALEDVDPSIVIVYGYSDDGVVLRGAIQAAYDCMGGTITVDAGVHDRVQVTARFDHPDTQPYVWTYEPVEGAQFFDIVEDDKPLNRGMVFSLDDVAPHWKTEQVVPKGVVCVVLDEDGRKMVEASVFEVRPKTGDILGSQKYEALRKAADLLVEGWARRIAPAIDRWDRQEILKGMERHQGWQILYIPVGYQDEEIDD